MGWFFRKREDIDSKINNIDKKMSYSFQNVKKDMQEFSSWMKEIHTNHNNHKQTIDFHQKKIEEIENKIDRILYSLNRKEPEKQIETKIASPQINNESVIGMLTATDKKLFGMIYQLQKQLGGNPVSFKSLSNMAYPGEDYVKMRSTISQYLNTLYKFGLIEKKRHGREAFIYMTQTGLNLIKERKNQENRMKPNRKSKPVFDVDSN